jgi:hypothetical protein
MYVGQLSNKDTLKEFAPAAAPPVAIAWYT